MEKRFTSANRRALSSSRLILTKSFLFFLSRCKERLEGAPDAVDATFVKSSDSEAMPGRTDFLFPLICFTLLIVDVTAMKDELKLSSSSTPLYWLLLLLVPSYRGENPMEFRDEEDPEDGEPLSSFFQGE